MHQDDDEIFIPIIRDSKKKLQTLKILSNFFNHPVLFAVLIRTKVIHNLFENNRSLDSNKLELFHLQYTQSLIDLFQKLKKTKEQSYLLLADEIYINDDFIGKLKLEIDASFFRDVAYSHAKKLSLKIEQLYKGFAFENLEVFHWNEITEFSSRRANEFYREISKEQFDQLVAHHHDNVYENKFVTIEKKLLGRLNIHKFRIKFTCGLKQGNELLEIYEFVDSNDRFVFHISEKSFYFLDDENTKGIDLSKNQSVKKQIIDGLQEKNRQLTAQQESIKTQLSSEVEAVLESYAAKISEVEFLNDLQNVDEQTNILKAMLNININSNNGN